MGARSGRRERAREPSGPAPRTRGVFFAAALLDLFVPLFLAVELLIRHLHNIHQRYLVPRWHYATILTRDQDPETKITFTGAESDI